MLDLGGLSHQLVRGGLVEREALLDHGMQPFVLGVR